MKRLARRWYDLSIRTKFFLLAGVMLVMVWSVVFAAVFRFQEVSHSTDVIMGEYQQITGFMDTFSAENMVLETYVRPYTENGLELYQNAIAQTDEYLQVLTPDIRQDARTEYVLKRAIRNAMSYYRQSQTVLFALTQQDEIIEQYLYLKTQAVYIDSYARELLHTRSVQAAEQWQQIARSNQRSNRQFVGLLLLSTLVMVLALFLFTRSILTPLAELGRAADRISARQYDAPPLAIRGGDELGRTARSFNSMQEDIRRTIHALEKQSEMEKHLLEREVEAEQMHRRLQEGRFAQLQSQINPHFLFNTLSTIAALAREEGALLTEDLILRLSSFFRYSLESDERMVPLGREIQLLRDYIELQETRYGSRIRFEVVSDQQLEQLMVPKFILQPLVENAIIHGLRERQAGGMIRVRSRVHRGMPTVTCTDNGKGFDTRKPRPEGTRRSVGLNNIAERMELSGGRLEVFSIRGVGTCARIILGTDGPGDEERGEKP